MRLTVRIYGPTFRGSWPTLTRGYSQALRSFGALAGVVPVDDFDQDDSYDGADADVALVLGPPSGMHLAKLCGDHRLVYFMFAPNTLTVPTHITNGIMAGCDIMLVPSYDALSSMIQFSHVPVDRIQMLQHGVGEPFRPVPHPDPHGPFTILHHAWSAFERKGTRELMEAFRTWKYRDQSRLVVSCPEESAAMLDHSIVSWRKSGGVHTAWAQYEEAHVVCQPSRAEGFGLVGFESRACGRPVAATPVGEQAHACIDTIHFGMDGEGGWEYSESPLMCELGESAPDVPVKAIQAALTAAFLDRDADLARCMAHADEFRASWSWEARTADWYWRQVPVDLAREACTRREADTVTSEGTDP